MLLAEEVGLSTLAVVVVLGTSSLAMPGMTTVVPVVECLGTAVPSMRPLAGNRHIHKSLGRVPEVI